MSNFLSSMRSCAVALLLLMGLCLTAFGAYIASRGVIISEQDATELASPKWDMNERLRKSLIDQSQNAKLGLMLVVVGTAFQAFGTVLSVPTNYAAFASRKITSL
jgi:hypothetical protein